MIHSKATMILHYLYTKRHTMNFYIKVIFKNTIALIYKCNFTRKPFHKILKIHIIKEKNYIITNSKFNFHRDFIIIIII